MSAEELAGTTTLFESFMGFVAGERRTFAQLLAIYRDRRTELDAADDRYDDLRVERYIDDMAGSRWRSDVVLRLGVFDDTPLVIDGIHRGLAYLACVEKGIAPARLPALQISR